MRFCCAATISVLPDKGITVTWLKMESGEPRISSRVSDFFMPRRLGKFPSPVSLLPSQRRSWSGFRSSWLKEIVPGCEGLGVGAVVNGAGRKLEHNCTWGQREQLGLEQLVPLGRGAEKPFLRLNLRLNYSELNPMVRQPI